MSFDIRPATKDQVPLILSFIKELAEYEKLLHEVVATEERLSETLFGNQPKAEVVFAYYEDEPIGFALFFHNYSTFLAKPGLYLEDLYIKPSMRRRGFGQRLLCYLAKLALERQCGRLEWWVLDWNEPAIAFYQRIGAAPMDDWTVYRVDGANLANLAKSTSIETN